MPRSLSPADAPRSGLRERKKLKTRLAIQEHALRLFEQRGYERTTVEQIAEAAKSSPSTFFRYFPSKEDVVLFDALDPWLIESFSANRRTSRPSPRSAPRCTTSSPPCPTTSWPSSASAHASSSKSPPCRRPGSAT